MINGCVNLPKSLLWFQLTFFKFSLQWINGKFTYFERSYKLIKFVNFTIYWTPPISIAIYKSILYYMITTRMNIICNLVCPTKY